MCQSLQLIALRLNSLYYSVNVVDRLVMLFWRGMRYTINVLYCRSLSPFSHGVYRFTLIVMGFVKEDIEVYPCLLVDGLTSPLYDVLVEHLRMCHKGDPF